MPVMRSRFMDGVVLRGLSSSVNADPTAILICSAVRSPMRMLKAPPHVLFDVMGEFVTGDPDVRVRDDAAQGQ